jgi:transposase
MDRYIGLDVHAQSCTLAVVGPSGRRLKSQVLETNGRVLVAAVQSIPGRLHLCLEEGTQSAWLHELLSPHVEELVVTFPTQRKGPKDDLRDALDLAEKLRTGTLDTRVYKAPKPLAGLQNAVRAYGMVTRDIVRTKNRLKAVFRARGIATDKSVYESERRSRWLKKLPSQHRRLADWIGQELDALVPLQEQAEAWVQEEAKAHPIIKALSTAPGMGTRRSAQVVAIVGTPHRFRTRRQFWSYCGLGIVTRSSSDWVHRGGGDWVRKDVTQTRGLNRNRRPQLKAVFKGAATTVIHQLHDHPLYADYQRMLKAGTKPNLAKLTLARRIAAAVLAMWKHEESYDPKRLDLKKRP